jgi:hypothetical protein
MQLVPFFIIAWHSTCFGCSLHPSSGVFFFKLYIQLGDNRGGSKSVAGCWEVGNIQHCPAPVILYRLPSLRLVGTARCLQIPETPVVLHQSVISLNVVCGCISLLYSCHNEDTFTGVKMTSQVVLLLLINILTAPLPVKQTQSHVCRARMTQRCPTYVSWR